MEKLKRTGYIDDDIKKINEIVEWINNSEKKE